ncbi:alpha/beta hydrolase [Kibdelosporangium philippinense]|uniref:Alpha/beta hydrolase n=1 Tax=Kibdelosporangium philippinense TaxID=211113 RepID=A0ABS8Z3X6_9PSEU|nr:prolyl oligopeptidase family serine peptidase [Kibdelosporangium philippinense]MCE7002631.1 alpha/beta hydrolase [Kibdelosporangium philippinense]
MGEPITGTAAGVPYTALPPSTETNALVVSWHMMDAPRTNAAFAAALPLNDVAAWRVHFGLPFCGARMDNGTMDAALERAKADSVLGYFALFIRLAVEEFPAALADVRKQLSIGDGLLFALGGSLGAAIALQNLTKVSFAGAAIVNGLIRVRAGVSLAEDIWGTPYQWTEESAAAADELDFIARAAELAETPLLVVSGEEDHPVLRADAAQLVEKLPNAELATIPGLAHPLADEPGMEPAPQLPVAKKVDERLTQWFAQYV